MAAKSKIEGALADPHEPSAGAYHGNSIATL